jgi:hypothetical protein
MWSHLFIDTDATVFANVTTSELVVRDERNATMIITWDYGYGVSVDATSARAREWLAELIFFVWNIRICRFVRAHKQFLSTWFSTSTVNTFVFDYGESSWYSD